MTDRSAPPQNIEAEMSVLGAILLDNSCMSKVLGTIDAGDFYREGHRTIMKAMMQLHLKREPIELVTVSKKLKEMKSLEEVGGGSYVSELVDYVPTAANVAYYCRMVKEAAASRAVISYAQDLLHKAYEMNPAEVVAQAKAGIAEIAGAMDTMNGVSAGDILNLSKRAERYYNYVNEVETKRFRTGFDLVDGDLRGVAPGEVLTIIAYAGTFKTAFLQNLLLRGAEKTGKYHLFFSLEMPAEKVTEREIQIQAGVTGVEAEKAVKDGKVGVDMIQYAADRGSRGLLVIDKPRLTLEKVGRYIELARSKYGDIGAVGIDYLGLIKAPGKTLYERMEFAAPEVKNMAKEFGVPIILLCQINREGAREQYDINTFNAKGGGDIEAGADFMLGFYLDKDGSLICKILKNRNGPTNSRYLVDINRSTLQFQGMSRYTAPPATREKKADLGF